MVPKRRFWTDEQMMKCGFSIDFSIVRRPNRLLTPAKRTSKMRFSSFVPISKIFVWEAQTCYKRSQHSRKPTLENSWNDLANFIHPNEDVGRQPNTSHDIAHVCFVSPSLQYRYKENIRRSSCLFACCVLCLVSPSLQCCYIRRSSRMLGVSKSSHSPSSLEWGHDTSKSDRYTPTPFDPLSVHLVGFSR